ncbi:tRNA-modifying protein YgfZ [Buchnera aphidicola (Ceratoglyphina bambusae)]|uniref:tRNA-modifying protein YgfZ n=1 Tax=Buchnera aphidicola TaxID=9 RepID=UPI0031B8A116
MNKLIYLENWSLVTVLGKDSKKYLQSQFTNDIEKLSRNRYSFGSHCNVNGKIINIFIIFHYLDGYAYIQRNYTSEIQVNMLKKYSIFSNVCIFESQKNKLFGFFGKSSKFFLEKHFNISFNYNHVIRKKNIIFLRIKFPIERFIIISSIKVINRFKKKFLNKIIFENYSVWDLFDMEFGFPIITKIYCQKFFPNFFNSKKLNLISFNKGCYMGQEILCKIKYKNIKNKKLFLIFSRCNVLPNIGDNILKIKKNKNIISGKVLFSVKNKNYTFVQCILNNKIKKDTLFKIENINKNIFFLKK